MSHTSAPVFLHAGFGGIASLDFHRFLAANQEGLSLDGYGFADHAPSPMPVAGMSVTAARGPDPQATILSLPSLVGPIETLLTGRFFAAAEIRATSLRAALGRPVRRMALIVQPYETLFRAAWRQAALARQTDPFDHYAGRMADATGGWCDLVETLADRLGASEVVVVAKPAPTRRLLGLLVPGTKLAFPKPHAAPPQVTETAITALQRLRRQQTPLAPGQVERLLAFHAKVPQNPQPSDYDGLSLADLRGRYVADLAMLSRRPGVTVELEPLPFMPARRQAIAAE